MWRFWIDVGGTFTDCFAQDPAGRVRRGKVLSSGVWQGRCRIAADGASAIDEHLPSAAADFWRGAQLLVRDEQGRSVDQATIVGRHGDAAGATQMVCDRPLRTPHRSNDPHPAWTYQLDPGMPAPLLAIHQAMDIPLRQALPAVRVRLGTTRGTNALLTRSGSPTAWVTTEGFTDLPLIGRQDRPHLFRLDIVKPPPLFIAAASIRERVDHQGKVLLALDRDQAREALLDLHQRGVESLAICLLNAYRNADHEVLLGELAKELGFQHIALSHQTSPLMGLVARGDTTIVDAYLTPVVQEYVQRIENGLGEGSELRLLTSAGGLVTAGQFTGKDSVLSGPAGGVVGYGRCAAAAGIPQAIGLDMGGTSTDVSRWAGDWEMQFETQKAGVRLATPMMAIETVAAGGGSICRFDGVRLLVGPGSAGADPGPACYGRGGPLTVTDCNVALGRLALDEFPFPLDASIVQERLAETAREVESATGRKMSLEELAAGFLDIANTHMVRAVRCISLARGFDPRDHVLAPFGGAAGQHACAIAEQLGIQSIYIHPDAGLLSAYGIGLAELTRHAAAPVYHPLNELILSQAAAQFAALEQQVVEELRSEGCLEEHIRLRRSAQLRYQGLEAALEVNAADPQAMRRLYEAAYERLHGFHRPQAAIEVVAWRVVGAETSADVPVSAELPSQPLAVQPVRTQMAWFDGQHWPTPVYRERELPRDAMIDGPAVLAQDGAAAVIAPGWRCVRCGDGPWLMRREPNDANPTAVAKPQIAGVAPLPSDAVVADDAADPVKLELFHNHFAAIAEQMGVTLRNTSSSVNVKERLDFSCALFTAKGELVVNAPHIPVHLGAMSETVRRVLEENPNMGPGDVIATNDPFRGGSHLPDVTVVTPVFAPMQPGDRDPGPLLFFTASRAHHAEIGGATPGSMPPFSRNLAEEGVLIRNFKVLDRFRPRYNELDALLRSGPYPSRSPQENLADVQAQVAANFLGSRELLQLCSAHGVSQVIAYMRHIQEASSQKVRTALAALGQGRREFEDRLDDGALIRAAIDIREDRCIIDFTGTSGVLAGNLNANRAIVTAAVMYTLRCLLDDDTPLNQGVLAPVQILLPECLLNPPSDEDPAKCAAVVGGNVETSQRVVDVLLGCLGLAAASQGTMNNVCFGDSSFGYYETICGGAGATPRAKEPTPSTRT